MGSTLHRCEAIHGPGFSRNHFRRASIAVSTSAPLMLASSPLSPEQPESGCVLSSSCRSLCPTSGALCLGSVSSTTCSSSWPSSNSGLLVDSSLLRCLRLLFRGSWTSPFPWSSPPRRTLPLPLIRCSDSSLLWVASRKVLFSGTLRRRVPICSSSWWALPSISTSSAWVPGGLRFANSDRPWLPPTPSASGWGRLPGWPNCHWSDGLNRPPGWLLPSGFSPPRLDRLSCSASPGSRTP